MTAIPGISKLHDLQQYIPETEKTNFATIETKVRVRQHLVRLRLIPVSINMYQVLSIRYFLSMNRIEESARTLGVLDVDGQKQLFDVKNAYSYISYLLTVVPGTWYILISYW